QMSVGIMYAGTSVHHKFGFRNLLNYRSFLIVLILDLPYQFFYDIFKRNHTSRSSKFIKDKSNLDPFQLELRHQVVDLFGLRNKIWLTHDVLQYHIFTLYNKR